MKFLQLKSNFLPRGGHAMAVSDILSSSLASSYNRSNQNLFFLPGQKQKFDSKTLVRDFRREFAQIYDSLFASLGIRHLFIAQMLTISFLSNFTPFSKISPNFSKLPNTVGWGGDAALRLAQFTPCLS